MRQLFCIDEEGYFIEPVLISEGEGIPKGCIFANAPEGLYVPKWDFEQEKWVEGLSDEEVQQREQEKIEQENKPSEMDVLAMAVMDLAEIVLNGGGK